MQRCRLDFFFFFWLQIQPVGLLNLGVARTRGVVVVITVATPIAVCRVCMSEDMVAWAMEVGAWPWHPLCLLVLGVPMFCRAAGADGD